MTSSTPHTTPHAVPQAPRGELDVREHGAPHGGEPQTSDRRLFLQFQAFTGCADVDAAGQALAQHQVEGALYADINDPWGIGLVLVSEDPGWFVSTGRTLLTHRPFAELRHRPELTMFGRTYSSGREADLEDWLLRKPRRTLLNPHWPWAVWYPLRRKSEFALLPREEQSAILAEHAKIGMAFGQAGYAADIRLACYGMDMRDNEFVLGLVGPQLHGLSALVQEMRKSQQTGRYIASMGPFFVGRACWQSPLRV